MGRCTVVVDLTLVCFVTLNAAAAVGCAYGYLREFERRQSLFEQCQLLRTEHAQAARELVSLRKTNRSLHEHADRMGQRAKAFAVELRGSDGTAKTSVWPQRKHEVFMLAPSEDES